MFHTRICLYLVVGALLWGGLNPVLAKPKKVFHTTPPDLTKGGAPDDTRDWSLGPIGANGWGFSRNTKNGGSALARQLLITRVETNTPADGALCVGDIILGVDGTPFARDARRGLASAINEAEREENKGQLDLLIWREGVEQELQISLPVLGIYSETAPFNCAKTDRIIDQAVDHLKTLELKDDWLGHINALGLMASGRKDVMPKVRAFAHSLVKPGEVLSIEKHVPMMSWKWSYKTLFLCEYVLLTGDETVMPTLTEYATKIAMGQSGAGTWGHTYAAIENTGKMHGHLGGYGAINQMGLTMMLVLPLAEKCGVDHPEVTDAIQRGTDFFSFFIGKGAIPYGDHGAANEWYDDNGKSGSAAILFDLLGNQEGAQFFADMVLASAPGGREAGHTGHFWSHLWGGVGAARAGEEGLSTFMREMDFIFTLERQPDGRMVFQGNVGEAGDRGKPKNQWDSTGARLLQLCVPRRTLYITGKETPPQTHLTAQRTEQILEAGRLLVDQEARSELSVPQILKYLADPLPPTRAMAASLLAERNLNIVDQLLPLLDSEDPYTRFGAAEALGKAGFASQEAADALIRLMEKDDDIQFKVYAINALIRREKQKGLLTVAKPAIPVLMRMALEDSPEDPRNVLQYDIGRALFYYGRAQPVRGLLPEFGLEGMDRTLMVPVVRKLLTNQNGWTRSTTAGWIYPRLTEEERAELWGDIYQATRYIAPSGIMFASEARTHGLELMSNFHVDEGLDVAAWYVRYQKGHGNKARVPKALDAILRYGTHAKRVVPELESHAKWYESKRNKRRGIEADDPAVRIREAIQKIEAATETPELISIN